MTDRAIAADRLRSWFEERLPSSWGLSGIEVAFDREEILILLQLEAGDEADPRTTLAEFRAATRAQRMGVAEEGESLFGRKVSWGAVCADHREIFTNLSVPVMTRLRMAERGVLDTLVDSGVARSRSEALAWCVRLVGTHEGDWIQELRAALVHVEKARGKGPDV